MQLINKYWDGPNRLKLFVQVNISKSRDKMNEKHGSFPSEALTICKEILKYPKKLELLGLMTIGSQDENDRIKEFQSMNELKNDIIKSLGLKRLELSMGMSNDYQIAVLFNRVILDGIW